MSAESRTNGFKIRALNADCDRLAVQSSLQSTWFLTFRKWGLPKVHEVGIAQSELIVLRPYQGAPIVEITGLGGPHGVLILERASGGARILRNGSKHRVELGRDEALVVKTENFAAPRHEGRHFART